jgi:hypothetical protein
MLFAKLAPVFAVCFFAHPKANAIISDIATSVIFLNITPPFYFAFP